MGCMIISYIRTQCPIFSHGDEEDHIIVLQRTSAWFIIDIEQAMGWVGGRCWWSCVCECWKLHERCISCEPVLVFMHM